MFCAEMSDYKIVYNILKAISFQEFAIFRAMNEGLKLTVEEMQSIETSVFVPRDMFCYYEVDTSKDVKFKISLKILTECLHIYGDDGNPSLKISYKSYGSPLCLVIKHNEENIIVDCEISTMNTDGFSDLSLADECNLNKTVINATPLFKILQALDNASDEIELNIKMDPPSLKFTTKGIRGESEVEIPECSEIVTSFVCKKQIKSIYAFKYIKQILKVMHYASKVTIAVGDSGLLGLQFVIDTEEKQMYVEYYVMAQYINQLEEIFNNN